MTSPTTLVVPIRVTALCVGEAEAQSAHGQAPMADFAHLPYADGGQVHNRGPYVSTRVLSHAGPFEGAVALPAGVHLHWTLPAGLSHAVQRQPGGPMEFPAVPTRWLVTRVWVLASNGKTETASWVVESDRLSATPTAAPGLAQPTVPFGATPGQAFRYLGLSSPLQPWTETGSTVARLSPLTAVGYGEPTFAAYYPNCSTVFGFYDPSSDLVDFDASIDSLTYYVAGWYGDPAADPLAGGGVEPGENPYGWTWSGGGTPTLTLCTGTIGGVPWNAAGTFLGAQPGPLTAALGASPQEALAALMADSLAAAHPDQDFSSAEALLNALQFGLLSRPLTPDSLEEFEEAVHAAGFGSLDAGTLWSVVSSGSSGSSEDGDGGEATLPAALGTQLDALNALQLQLNDLGRDVAGRRHQAFVDWYKYLVTAYEPQAAPPALRTRLTDIQRYLAAELAEIAAITGPGGALDALRAEVSAAASRLAAALDPSLRLAGDVTAPRFHRPADPVLVLSGPDVVPRGRPDPAGESGGMLRCRTSAELVTQLALTAGATPGSPATQVSASELPSPTSTPQGFPSGACAPAFQDAFFWTPALQPAVAHAIPSHPPQPAGSWPATVSLLESAARAFVAGEATGSVAYTGQAPAPRAAGEWSGTPWLPLLLQYDVSYGPLQPILPSTDAPAPYADDFIVDGFSFDADSIDLVYRGPPPQARQSYAGSTVLSAGAATDLAGSLRRWIEGTGSDDPRVAEALDAVASMPLLAQGMSGMGEEMLMRRQTLQMAVADPLAPVPVQPFVADVAAAVAGENALSPLPQVGFNPIRAGTLAVDRIRLVDAFGQVRDYRSPRVVVARGLQPPPGLEVAGGTAFLPPRIVQPSRLLFRWTSVQGGSESTSAPATSPVFGWVMPNYLDRALALYSAGGTPVGSLGLSADGRSVLWSVAPGGEWPIGTPLAQAMAGEDANLAAFATALVSGGAAYFAPFFEAVRDALAFSLPERFREDVGTAILLGQPLALARASLTLSLAGPAATDESWTSFAAAVLEGEGGAAWDGGLARVRFPVKLGAPSQLGDTLVGYWTAPGGETDWTRFYAPAASASVGPVGPPADDTLTLAPSPDSAPGATLTLLLDPRGQVHATTGILPVGAVSIPPSQYADALRALAVAFAAGPVLSGSNVPAEEGGAPPMSLVRPRVASGAWTWVSVANGAWTRTGLVDAPSAAGTLSYSPQHVSDGWMVLTGPGTSPSS